MSLRRNFRLKYGAELVNGESQSRAVGIVRENKTKRYKECTMKWGKEGKRGEVENGLGFNRLSDENEILRRLWTRASRNCGVRPELDLTLFSLYSFPLFHVYTTTQHFAFSLPLFHSLLTSNQHPPTQLDSTERPSSQPNSPSPSSSSSGTHSYSHPHPTVWFVNVN